MVRGKGGKEKRSMTMGERADLEGQKQEAEATLKFLEQNPGTSRQDVIDKGRLKKDIAYFNKVIHEGAPVAPRGINKDRLAAEAKAIEERISDGIPTRAEMDHPSRHPGAVRKHMIWAEKHEKDIQRYKEIMRRLEPDDPTATDVEKFRKEGEQRRYY